MSSIELNKRLLKRAGWGNDMASQFSTNEALGAAAGNHVLNLAVMTPGTYEFNTYVANNNLNMNHAMRFHEMGQNLLSRSLDQNVVKSIQSGDWETILNDPNIIRSIDLAEGGFETPRVTVNKKMTPGSSFGPIPGPIPFGADVDIENPEFLDSALGIARRTPTGTTIWSPDGQLLQPDKNKIRDYGISAGSSGLGIGISSDEATPEQLRRLTPFEDNPYLQNILRREAKGQLIQGMGQSLSENMNSEFMNRFRANMATAYLKNKIDEWAPTNSTMGRAFNGIGHWLLKMFSMVPGYQSIMNWLANWQHGDKFKSLPGRVQDYGRSLVQNQQSPDKLTASAQPAKNPNQLADDQVLASNSNTKMLPQAPTVPNVNDYQFDSRPA